MFNALLLGLKRYQNNKYKIQILKINIHRLQFHLNIFINLLTITLPTRYLSLTLKKK